MTRTFYWHDYETFGIDTRRDAPSQFGGIRTDADLNEIGEPLMLYCRPPRDALPDPGSCLITGITPQVCEERGVIEADFARRILAELAEPGTVGVGYNTLSFDDEVTRHLLWRNLIDPYGREYQNGCGRWDLFNVVRCVYALRPEMLNWPRKEDGRHSLKLEHLSAANGLAHESAHDALSDVRATIGLARLIRQRNLKLWNYCLSLCDKKVVQDIVGNYGTTRKAFLHVSGKYPQERGHAALVWPLGPHPVNRNEVIVWDLASDPLDLLDLSVADIRQRLFTRREEMPEGMERLPIKTIRINQSPVVVANPDTLKADRAQEIGLDVPAQLARAQAALARSLEFDRIDWRAVFQREVQDEGLDAEQTLYGGAFLGDEDRRTLQRMPALEPSALAAWKPMFHDARLDDLLLRYRARNWPGSLSEEEAQQWQAHCAERLHEGKGGFRTLQRYSDAIDELAETADERQSAVLEALVDWAETIAP